MAELVDAYRRAYRIRRVEEQIARRYHPDPADPTRSPMRTPVHLSVGQETVAVGVAMAVEDHELPMRHVWLSHRGHAVYLAFGGDLRRMVAELYGKATGCSGGRAGSMHLHDEEHGIMGGSPIVGSAFSLATGSAWAAKLEGSDRLTVVFAGDAATESGQFWESLNFASLYGLRLLYVIEDNKISTATPEEIRSGGLWDTFSYASGESMGHFRIRTVNDSWLNVYLGTRYVLADLPGILRVFTTRACEHVGPWIDRAALARRDPVHELMLQVGESWDDINRDVGAEVTAAFAAAEAAPWPEVIAR